MAEKGQWPAGQDRGHEVALHRQAPMTDRVDAPVDLMQPKLVSRASGTAARKAQGPELAVGDDAMLPGRQFSQPPLWTKLFPHGGTKFVRAVRSPPLGAGCSRNARVTTTFGRKVPALRGERPFAHVESTGWLVPTGS